VGRGDIICELGGMKTGFKDRISKKGPNQYCGLFELVM